jgi:hypothetical protein
VGAWGAGIFEDDVAADIRDEWEDAIEGGASAAEATAQLVSTVGPGVSEDEDDGPIFWIALAALQLEARALDPDVPRRAADAIEPNIGRWREEADADDASERERILRDLLRQLAD